MHYYKTQNNYIIPSAPPLYNYESCDEKINITEPEIYKYMSLIRNNNKIYNYEISKYLYSGLNIDQQIIQTLEKQKYVVSKTRGGKVYDLKLLNKNEYKYTYLMTSMSKNIKLGENMIRTYELYKDLYILNTTEILNIDFDRGTNFYIVSVPENTPFISYDKIHYSPLHYEIIEKIDASLFCEEFTKYLTKMDLRKARNLIEILSLLEYFLHNEEDDDKMKNLIISAINNNYKIPLNIKYYFTILRKYFNLQFIFDNFGLRDTLLEIYKCSRIKFTIEDKINVKQCIKNIVLNEQTNNSITETNYMKNGLKISDTNKIKEDIKKIFDKKLHKKYTIFKIPFHQSTTLLKIFSDTKCIITGMSLIEILHNAKINSIIDIYTQNINILVKKLKEYGIHIYIDNKNIDRYKFTIDEQEYLITKTSQKPSLIVNKYCDYSFLKISYNFKTTELTIPHDTITKVGIVSQSYIEECLKCETAELFCNTIEKLRKIRRWGYIVLNMYEFIETIMDNIL